MAYLFKVEGNVVIPNTETLLITPFKEIWERDTTPKKTYALEDFAYIEFTTSMKKSNPYRQYSEERKHGVVKEAKITREDWEVDNLIAMGQSVIIEFQTNGSSTYSYYMATKKAAENMKKFFSNVDVNERDARGKPVYTPKAITSALLDTERVLTSLKSLEKKVEEELYESTKNRADKEISPFAHANSLKRIV
tara:strand:- start:9395 stop:9973 length:579 start_codon:yes stop_codon:yes gene_type:complete